MAVVLYIEPLDTLFFRDSRPFMAGEDTFAESNLPSSLTVYGAIGSYILDSQDQALDQFISNFISTKLGKYSDKINSGKFRIKGPFLCFDKKPWFPPLQTSGFMAMASHPTY